MEKDRRKDLDTAELIREALRMQRSLGFERAFLQLRAQGMAVDLARDVLAPHHDRRLTPPKAVMIDQTADLD